MLLDIFPLNDELDTLEFRLRLLSPFVDYFVVCEADHTFSGKPKPYHYWDKRERFKPWAHKIVHHPIRIDVAHLNFGEKPEHYDPTSVWWHIEKTQRNALFDILTAPRKDVLELGIKPSDTVLMGDVDEFPSRKAMEWAREWMTADQFVACRQAFLYYDLTNLRHEHWHGTIITTVRMATLVSAQTMRGRRNMCGWIPEGGWHCSMMGGEEAIRRKLGDFSHAEYSGEEYTNAEHIQNCLKSGKDLFNRGIPSSRVEPKVFYPSHFQECAKFAGWL